MSAALKIKNVDARITSLSGKIGIERETFAAILPQAVVGDVRERGDNGELGGGGG